MLINKWVVHSFVRPVISLVPDLKKLPFQQGGTKYISPGLESTAPEAAQSKTAWDIKERVRASQKALQKESKLKMNFH